MARHRSPEPISRLAGVRDFEAFIDVAAGGTFAHTYAVCPKPRSHFVHRLLYGGTEGDTCVGKEMMNFISLRNFHEMRDFYDRVDEAEAKIVNRRSVG